MYVKLLHMKFLLIIGGPHANVIIVFHTKLYQEEDWTNAETRCHLKNSQAAVSDSWSSSPFIFTSETSSSDIFN